MTAEPRHLLEHFAVLKPGFGVESVATGPTLYERLDADYDGFAGHVLVAAHEFTGDWPTWECHPAGDEIVLLLSGNVTLLLRTGESEETVELTAIGSYVVVPRGVWHTARITGTARLLFVTPGEHTQNAPEPP